MNQQLIAVIAEMVLAVFMVAGFILVITAGIFDTRQAMRSKSLRKARSRMRGEQRPIITVLVYAKNNEETIIKCLNSIHGNHYGRYDVVVVNDASSDGTKRRVRNFIHQNLSKPFRLYSRRKRSSKTKALYEGYRRSKKGDLIMVIDGSTAMPDGFMKDSAVRFIFDIDINAMRFNSHVIDAESITMLYHRFWRQSVATIAKFRFFKKTQITISEDGVVYRRASFLGASKSKATDVIGRYDSNLVLVDNSIRNDEDAVKTLIPSRKRRINWVGSSSDFSNIIITLIVLSLQSYSIFAAASLQTPVLLILGCVVITIWLLLITWTGDVLDSIDKMELTFCSLFIYFLVYGHLVIYVVNFVMRLTRTNKRRVAINPSRELVRP